MTGIGKSVGLADLGADTGGLPEAIDGVWTSTSIQVSLVFFFVSMVVVLFTVAPIPHS